jgi:S1-C subfamily serine protease
VASAPHEFDDAFDDDERGPLLPPEDRLWRHPSEMHVGPAAAEARAARDRWLTSTPTRAGAWSAGFVGAVLATGVVLVGTHLTSWLGRSSPRPTLTAVVTTTMAPEETSTVLPTVADTIDSKVHLSLTVVTVDRLHSSATGNGVVLASNGMILVPMSLVAGASATTPIVVMTYTGEPFAGRVVGSDAATGLAVISIGSDALTPLAAAPDSDVSPGQWLAVEWSTTPHANSLLSIGAVDSPSPASAEPGVFELLDDLQLQALRLNQSPVGTVLLNSQGQLLGIIIKRDGDDVIEAPGDLAERVGIQIAKYGHVTHGWLGIEGESSYGPVSPPDETRSSTTDSDQSALPVGVKVLAVGPGTSAAVAGLRVGDVIEAVNGLTVDSMQALQDDLYTMPPLTAVRLTVERGRTVRTVNAHLLAAA